jgi:multidrug efflux pump subunit AcrA (membrane-fusion protein)
MRRGRSLLLALLMETAGEVRIVEPRASTEVPAVVTANAYREVKVTSLVGGIVRKVHAELGTAVRRGVPLATLFSSELAEAQVPLHAGNAGSGPPSA